MTPATDTGPVGTATRVQPAGGRLARLVRTPAFLASLVLCLTIFAANAVFILGIRSNQPLLYHSGLGSPTGGVLKGSYTIDPNIGWTAQALGRHAAEIWLHGDLPLWNVYEGLGQPLAGEMQSAAFFLPFILLQLLPNGIFAMHLALEVVAGFSTLLLLRSLKLSWVAATCGACLFAVNGAFSVMQNAPFNPIAFLPMALWGIELLAQGIRKGRIPRAGFWVTSLAFAWMLYAGFPETAYLEGLFAAIWAAVRLAQLSGVRARFMAWTGISVLSGVVLAAPVLIAFADFLTFGFLAYHSGPVNNLSYSMAQITSLALPYAVGPLGNSVFGLQAGYLTLSTVLLALVGLAGREERALKITLGVTTSILLLNTFGATPVKVLLNLVPGISSILVYKYGLVLIEFAVIVCAAFAVDDLRRARPRSWAIVVAGLVAGGYVLGSILYLHRNDLIRNWSWTAAVLGVTAFISVTVFVLLVLGRWTRTPRWPRLLAGFAVGLVVLEAVGTYAVPQLVASPRGPVDIAPIRFLQANLGTSRFYTLGPIMPNYGSYFGIAQLNANDLPVPQKYADYVTQRLRPAEGAPGVEGTARYFSPYQLVPFNPGVAEEKKLLKAYGQQQAHFRAAAVKYIVMRPGVADSATGATYGLVRVFKDARTEIWEDPDADTMYTTTGNGCRLDEQSMWSVSVSCVTQTTLMRRQLSSPGWTAIVNGEERALVDSPGQVFQQLDLPVGSSTVSFEYRPRFFTLGMAASMGLGLAMVADLAVFLARRRRARALDSQ